ncbi:hypothetical protein MMC09_001398 [Bachmanniomyces sp. S44760]|nr:hypothetical protein [Bachmanniomyces sp. S44760]
MYFSAIVILYGAHLATASVIATCDRNNCLRAVIASNFPTRHPSDDCSSFLAKTITPDTITVTSTVTPTITLLNRDIIVPRQTQASLPVYALPCSSSAAYSSACSCIGVTTGPTVTASPISTTTTKTGSSTVTACANPLPTFVLRLGSSVILPPGSGTNIKGTYDEIDFGDGPLIGFNGSPKDTTQDLSLDAAGHIVIQSLGLIGATASNQAFELLHFDTPANVADPSQGETPAVCSISGGVLKCHTSPGQNILQLCPGAAVTNDLFIGTTLRSGCDAVILDVVPICTP